LSSISTGSGKIIYRFLSRALHQKWSPSPKPACPAAQNQPRRPCPLARKRKSLCRPQRVHRLLFHRSECQDGRCVLTLTGAKELYYTRRQFILAIGINEQSNPEFKLTYAVDDARAVADAVRTHREVLPFPYAPIRIAVVTPEGTQWKP
jgi:hypothetical protein